MRLLEVIPVLFAALALSACSDLRNVGQAPEFSPLVPNLEHHALYNLPLPEVTDRRRPADNSSLWSSSQQSLLGDRRANQPGDILTVVIEIDDRAEISNSSQRGRSGSQSMAVPEMLGLPQLIDRQLPEGASMANAVSADSSSSFQGSGSVSRNERLTLRVATTIIERLPNGVVRIEGSQEVRVNNELRELIVTGYIRPTDISRRNEIAYDRIAGARISYGGRGQISQMQQPRYGQQIAEILLPL
ncbi:flagellar basal body L-ring protein FlgH [Pararhodobacter sp.]|uniref:flagellar basal body L-ring protein FlgH n=1 Tax=Pararhodobacter sp. TaxID=2127056 RepID=UPI002AFDE0C1|nr:flagellar basal body L-ring protein FlgH [Pararhodobacter sp.]